MPTGPKKSRHAGGHHRQGQGRRRWFKTSPSWEGGVPPTLFPRITPMMLASKMFSDQLKPGDVLFPTAAESRRRTRRTRHNLTFQGQTFHFDICPLKIILDLCRSNDFLPIRPPSPLHSSYPRPVARVAPGGFRLHEILMKNLTTVHVILFYFSVECRR